MVDLCLLNPIKCCHGGQCVTNITSNTTYCKCDQCHQGILCERIVLNQTDLYRSYIYLIIYIIELCLSVLNNSLALELFIGSRQIRRTNCGVYLIVYSILSLVSSILLVVDATRLYYIQHRWITSREEYDIYDCYLSDIGCNIFVYLCVWFSACVAYERGLFIFRGTKANASLCRSFLTTIVIFMIAGGSATPFLLYKCKWNQIPTLQVARVFVIWFYVIIGIAIYALATLLVLISFTRRIRQYGTENGSFIKTFRKLLYTHLFILVPPIAYTISYIPDTVDFHLRNPKDTHFQCGVSTEAYVVNVILETWRDVPFILTWLLFVYPSKVYMTEFYMNTWSGQHFARILKFLKSFSNNRRSTPTHFTNSPNN